MAYNICLSENPYYISLDCMFNLEEGEKGYFRHQWHFIISVICEIDFIIFMICERYFQLVVIRIILVRKGSICAPPNLTINSVYDHVHQLAVY